MVYRRARMDETEKILELLVKGTLSGEEKESGNLPEIRNLA